MANAENYDPALKYGATLITNDYGAGSLTGSKTSLNNFYVTVGVGSSVDGKTVVPIFGGTAPTAGTVTGFWIVGAGTAGSAVLWGTTAGTIAAFTFAATSGAFQGTAVLNAAVASGDSFQAYNTGNGQGTCTYFVTFITPN